MHEDLLFVLETTESNDKANGIGGIKFIFQGVSYCTNVCINSFQAGKMRAPVFRTIFCAQRENYGLSEK